MSCSESFSSDSDGKDSAATTSYVGATATAGGGTGAILDPVALTFGTSSSYYYGGDILYCKARGMPLDHIGNNAILCFDKGLERVHGAELKCSHPSCMKDGIKFRYCKHCNKPVAKRNFRKRHAHPELMELEDAASIKNSSSFQQQSQQLLHQQQQSSLLQQQEPPLPPLLPAMMSQQQLHHDQQLPPLAKQPTTSMMLSMMPPLMSNGYSSTTNPSRTFPSEDNHHQEQQNQATSCKTLHSSTLGGEIKYTSSLQHHHTPKNHTATPQMWIDLYQRRPVGGNIIQQQEWLQSVMAVAELGPATALNTNKSDLTEVEGERSISNSISAVREEFCRSFPPRFVSCGEDIGLEQGMPKYRQHGESLSLQINTDLDIFGTNGIMLDSNGSIVISCSSQSYRETPLTAEMQLKK